MGILVKGETQKHSILQGYYTNKLRIERKFQLRALTSEYTFTKQTSQVFFDNLYGEQNLKIYKWKWHVLFSGNEDRDVTQEQEVESMGAFDP